jgi:hypothetical protein
MDAVKCTLEVDDPGSLVRVQIVLKLKTRVLVDPGQTDNPGLIEEHPPLSLGETKGREPNRRESRNMRNA